jgi:hypothetical protein
LSLVFPKRTFCLDKLMCKPTNLCPLCCQSRQTERCDLVQDQQVVQFVKRT